MNDPNGQINVQDHLPEVGVLEQARQMAHLLIERGYSALKAEIEAMEDHRDPKQMNQVSISQANEHDPRESLDEREDRDLFGRKDDPAVWRFPDSLDEIMALIERNIHGEGNYYDLQNLLAFRESKLERHPWVDKEEGLPLEQVIS